MKFLNPRYILSLGIHFIFVTHDPIMRSVFLLGLLFFSWRSALGHEGHSHDVLCRVCGETLFDSASHIAGTVLSGPRVEDVKSEELLGEGGTLHVLRKVGSKAGSVEVALFDTAAANGKAVIHRASVKTPVFPGYAQKIASCSRCNAPFGWRFIRAGLPGSEPSAEESLKGGKAAAVKATTTAGAAIGGGGECGQACVDLAASGALSFTEKTVEARLKPALLAISEAPTRGQFAVVSDPKIKVGVGGVGCLFYPEPYWTYRYCPDFGVDQFHVDVQPAGAHETRWSMGDADKTAVRADGSHAKAQGHAYVQVRYARFSAKAVIEAVL